MKIIAVSIMLLLFINSSIAQEKGKELPVEDILLKYLSVKEDKINDEEVHETLYHFYNNPINLNNTTIEELEALKILSPRQIHQFFLYHAQVGPFLSIYELQVIPHFDVNTIQLLLPFITLQSQEQTFRWNTLLKSIRKQENTELITKYSLGITSKVANMSNKFLGDPHKIYMRFRSNTPKDVSFGITMEKDAGEKITWNKKNKTYGADFISYHFALFEKGFIKSLILGDYQLQYGQGILFGTGFNYGKGTETITTIKRSYSGIKPYTSSMENGFFRGAATMLQLNSQVWLSVFYSSKNIDGNIMKSDSTSPAFLSTIGISGYHRTAKELANKCITHEKNMGGNISLKLNKNLDIGWSCLHTQYGIPVIKDSLPYHLFSFSGTNNSLASMDVDYILKNFNFFSEIALSSSKSHALIAGLIASLDPKLDFSILYRHYDTRFHSFYQNSFGENNSNNNERGLYLGLKIKPNHKTTLSLFYDRFKFPWLKYNIKAPTAGSESMLHLSYSFTKKTLANAMVKVHHYEKTIYSLSPVPTVTPIEKVNFLFHFSYQGLEKITLQSRIQWSILTFSDHKKYGYYLMHELGKEFKKFRLAGCFALFDSEDSETRQYAYEKDVLYGVSIPSFSQKGTRVYLLSRIKVNKNLDLWIKLSRTKFLKSTTPDTGQDQISGNKISEIKLQLRYKFN